MTDVRIDRITDLCNLTTDYYDYSGSQTGKFVATMLQDALSISKFLSYAGLEDHKRARLKASGKIDGILAGVKMFGQPDEIETLTLVLETLDFIMEGTSATYEANRYYPKAVAALIEIIAADPDVHWEELGEGHFFIINEWIDETPLMVEPRDGQWHWSLSRDRDEGLSPTMEEAMRAGEAALGWTQKPLLRGV